MNTNRLHMIVLFSVGLAVVLGIVTVALLNYPSFSGVSGQLFTAARAPQPKPTVRPGTYQLSGYNPGSTSVGYTGSVTVQKEGSTYFLSWTIGAGQSHLGVGLLTGNVLSVAYYTPDFSNLGVVSYRVGSNRTLDGTWVSSAGGPTGREILTWKFE